jgi:hypothetical protein
MTDKYIKQYLVQAAKDLKELQRLVPKIPKLDGFIGEWQEDENYWYAGENRLNQKYVLSNLKDEIKFTFNPGGDGTTSFKVKDGWRTFDRIGVESSFYWKHFNYKGAPKVYLNEVLNEQLERIAKSREYSKTAITIPQIGFSVSPDGLRRLKEAFKKKGWIASICPVSAPATPSALRSCGLEAARLRNWKRSSVSRRYTSKHSTRTNQKKGGSMVALFLQHTGGNDDSQFIGAALALLMTISAIFADQPRIKRPDLFRNDEIDVTIV